MQRDGNLADPARRRRDAAVAGHGGDEAAARAAWRDAEPVVRATALGALARLGCLTGGDLVAGLADPDPRVRRRACEVAAGSASGREGTGALAGAGPAVLGALGDADPTVVEVAAWALGELAPPPAGAVDALAAVARDHRDALCREAAVAALGAIGDHAGLPAVLAATHDKPAVRRRAVLALAAFEGAEVDAALDAARHDRDWQVRQAAEDLLAGDDPDEPSGGG